MQTSIPPNTPGVEPRQLLAGPAAAGARTDRMAVWGEVLLGVLVVWLASRVTIFAWQVTGANAMSWNDAVGRESIWCITAIVCALLLPTGIRYAISFESTWRAVALAWPVFVLALPTYVLVFSHPPFADGIARPLLLAVSVGIAEEILFRVLLVGWLVSRLDARTALLVGSIAFALAHVTWGSANVPTELLCVTPQFAVGTVLGAIFLRGRNPLGNMFLHAAWDFPFFVGFGLVSGGSTASGAPPLSTLIEYLVLAIYGFFLVRPGNPDQV